MHAATTPGFGDYEAFPVTSPRDPRFDSAREYLEEAALKVIAQEVLDERMASATWIEDAFSELTHEDYKVMAAALADGNPHRAGELLRDAVSRIVKADAAKEAKVRLARLHREDEEEAALARAGI